MQVQGVVISSEVDVQVAKNGGGSYPGARLTYRDSNGKVAEQAFHENAFKFAPQLKNTLKSLQAGDKIIIDKEKPEGSSFWKVNNITKVVEGQAPTQAETQKAVASPKSTYETPEERAKKQVYIIRQSSIERAIEYMNHTNKNYKVEEAIKVAKQIESYVLDTEYDDGSIQHLKGDESEVL